MIAGLGIRRPAKFNVSYTRWRLSKGSVWQNPLDSLESGYVIDIVELFGMVKKEENKSREVLLTLNGAPLEKAAILPLGPSACRLGLSEAYPPRPH
jgi:hypothetical protein